MIVDLDELATKCADPRSRAYIQEAIQCYKAGAHRAAVVACWIAVAFDLIDKIREIAATGDAEAAKQIARFDQIRRDDDIPASLAFERGLPDMALHKFEFISQMEHVDLKRLQDDRNRCAHPSMVSETDVFVPPAELARLHIVNSMRNILMHPPAQGKAALDRLQADLVSPFFPAKPADVLTSLQSGPLKRARDSLVRNYCVILMKAITMHDPAPAVPGLPARALNAMLAVQSMHPVWWSASAAAVVNQVVSARTSVEDLARVVMRLCGPSGRTLWPLLSEGEQLRVRTFAGNIPSQHVDDLEGLEVPASPIAAEVRQRFGRMTRAEVLDTFWIVTPQLVIDKAISHYARSDNFAEANRMGVWPRSAAGDSEQPAQDVEAIIVAASRNDQIRHSNELSSVLNTFARLPAVGQATVDALKASNGL